MSTTQATSTLVYEAVRADDAPDEWVVEAIDYDREGIVYAARFSGQFAEERAQQYAAWQNSGRGWKPRQ